MDAAIELGATDAQRDILAVVMVKDHARRTSNAGTGCAKFVTINLHLNKDEEEYRDTLLHELAHALCDILYTEPVGHSQRWKNVMVAMGQPPERCHTMSLAEAYPDKYREHKCSCGTTFEFSKRKLNKMRRGAIFRCDKCNSPVNALNEEERSVAARIVRNSIIPVHPAYMMVCDKCPHKISITKRRYNLIRRGQVYSHAGCGGTMRLK